MFFRVRPTAASPTGVSACMWRVEPTNGDVIVSKVRLRPSRFSPGDLAERGVFLSLAVFLGPPHFQGGLYNDVREVIGVLG